MKTKCLTVVPKGPHSLAPLSLWLTPKQPRGPLPGVPHLALGGLCLGHSHPRYLVALPSLSVGHSSDLTISEGSSLTVLCESQPCPLQALQAPLPCSLLLVALIPFSIFCFFIVHPRHPTSPSYPIPLLNCKLQDSRRCVLLTAKHPAS